MALRYGLVQHQWTGGNSQDLYLIRHAPTLANNHFFKNYLVKKYRSHLNVTLNIHTVKKKRHFCAMQSWFAEMEELLEFKQLSH